MPVTDDPNDPELKEIEPSGMQKSYLVLSEEERAKGFVRPLRTSYIHVGVRPTGPTRELTELEHQRYDQYGYVLFEEYTDKSDRHVGRFWTKEQLESGCNQVTTMGLAIAETYARQPDFYGGTFCVNCGKHFPIGPFGEFVWSIPREGTPLGEQDRVGT